MAWRVTVATICDPGWACTRTARWWNHACLKPPNKRDESSNMDNLLLCMIRKDTWHLIASICGQDDHSIRMRQTTPRDICGNAGDKGWSAVRIIRANISRFARVLKGPRRKVLAVRIFRSQAPPLDSLSGFSVKAPGLPLTLPSSMPNYC